MYVHVMYMNIHLFMYACEYVCMVEKDREKTVWQDGRDCCNVCVCVCVCVWMYAHTYIHTYVIHTYIHTYINTYIHTYIHT